MGLVDAIAEQHERRAGLDTRLPVLDRVRLRDLLTWSGSFAETRARTVVVDSVVAALAWPMVEHYGPDSDKLAYYEPHTGVASGLTLRNGDDRSCEALGLLLKRLGGDWLAAGATGANILWPCRDLDIEVVLAREGFSKDACIAYKPASSVATPLERVPAIREADLVARSAIPADEPVLLRLQEEVLRAHIPDSPFARYVPGVRSQFRKRLDVMWSGRSPMDGGCLVVVVEEQGQILGMSELFVRWHSASLDMLLPEGRYGYVNTFGVLPGRRGSGIGRFLARSVDRHLQGFQPRGSYLYYSYYNPGAVAFWSKLGYVPLWRTYQQRDLGQKRPEQV